MKWIKVIGFAMLFVVGLQAQASKASAEELLNEAQAGLKAGDFAKAEFWFRDLRTSYPRDLRGGLGLIAALDAQNKVGDALKVARETEPLFPKSAVHSMWVGRLLVKLDRTPEAMDAYQRALTKAASPAESAVIYGLIGDGYQDLDELDLAIGAYRKAKQMSGRPSFPLAYSLGVKGDFTSAETEYRAVLRENPDVPAALNNLAYGWAERGENLNEALVFSQRAVALSPRVAVMEDTLGWVYFKRGMIEDAETTMLGALSYEGGNQGTLREHLAAVMDARGAWTEDRRALRALLEGDLNASKVARMKLLIARVRVK
ncbi:MAG: tetratricopeptide repeat protein [Bryobacteraceae bacterium]